MKKITVLALSAVFVFGLNIAFAADYPDDEEKVQIRISPSFETSFIMGGAMGDISTSNSKWTPDSRDIFSNGYGPNLEVGRMLDRNWEAFLGIGYMYYQGGEGSVTDAYKDRIYFKFSDMSVIPMCVGARLLLSNDPKKGFTPYIKADIGAIYVSGVDADLKLESASSIFDSAKATETWWEPSFHFLYEMGGGAEYRSGNLSVFFEIIGRGYSAPKSAGQFFVNGVLFDPDGTGWNVVNTRLGLSYYF